LSGLLQEYAVASMQVFDNCHSQTHTFEKLLLQFLHGHFQEIGDEPDFGPTDPDISPFRPGAASPALQTLEVQPGRIPRKFIAEFHRDYFTTEFGKIDNRLLIIDDSKTGKQNVTSCNNQ
jgi:hypothetical protein